MQKLTKEVIKIYKKNEEVVNYIIVGGLTTVISFITYTFFSKLIFDSGSAIDIQISTVLSWVFAVLFAFITNKKYVFKSQSKKVEKEIVTFTLSRVFSLLVEMFMMFMMVTILSMNDIIAKLIVQVVVIVLNYVLSKLFVFKKSHD